MKKNTGKKPPQSAPAGSPLKCRINGREASFSKGTLIIQAFKKLGMELAHYCWHPGLSAAGACRLCMVEIKGQKKLQIACNTEIQDGMDISSQSEPVREAVKWGLEYHLINHPLDCPICDQAGECALQDQYMRFGAYSPSMSQPKVKKRKAVNLGPKIVLDTERCILCSRCVRFTDEVSKTHELGIFDRGDRSEIGVFKDKPLDNIYAMNTVDICPVGALTSKDFRFKQRVWNLKTADSVCSGCATGCAIHADYNEEGVWRVRPRFNPEVNGHWMCDKGRDLFKSSNPAGRLRRAMRGQGASWETLKPLEALKEMGRELFWGGARAPRGRSRSRRLKNLGRPAGGRSRRLKKNLKAKTEPVIMLRAEEAGRRLLSSPANTQTKSIRSWPLPSPMGCFITGQTGGAKERKMTLTAFCSGATATPTQRG